MKHYCFVKYNVNQGERQDTNWEKIIAKDISDKGLLFKTKSSNKSTIGK